MSNDDIRSEIRTRLRALRRSIDPATGASRAVAAATVLDALAVELGATTVGAYMAIDGEADPFPFVEQCRRLGRQVTMPVVVGDGLRFVMVDASTTMLRHELGMLEPADGERIGIDDLDLVVIPAIAVDRAGTRLGFGGGYYDRALGSVPGPSRPFVVALVHPEQVVERLGRHPWDVTVDAIVAADALLRVE